MTQSSASLPACLLLATKNLPILLGSEGGPSVAKPKQTEPTVCWHLLDSADLIELNCLCQILPALRGSAGLETQNRPGTRTWGMGVQ